MTRTATSDRLRQMRADWLRLLGSFGVTAEAADPVFDRLAAAYTEPHRHYHTLGHLAEMFAVVDRLAGSCADERAVRLAVWFHDAVYDPKATDNEERSGRLAAESLAGLAIGPDMLEKVAELVRATAHLSDDAPPADADAAVLLDADLAIVAAGQERYRQYAADIRREYAWVPDDAYRAGRAKVLEHFLARPRIYHTAEMIEAAEEAARRNIRAELAELR